MRAKGNKRQMFKKCALLLLLVLLLVSCRQEIETKPPGPSEPEVIPPARPTADFSATPTEGAVPLTVTFHDQSEGDITQWNWDFGDGKSSSEQQPVHTYTSVGTFSISLTVTGPNGDGFLKRADYVDVTPEVISWEEALNYVGQTKAVEGVVVGAKYASTSKGRPTFLNIGKPYPEPGRFTVLIWGTERKKFELEFPPNPESYFLNKRVQVTGLIEEYKGDAEIILNDPSKIKVVK